MKIVGIFYCSMEPGYANLDLLSLFGELSKKHQIYLFSLSKQEDKNNLKYYKIKPFLSHWTFYMLRILMLIRKIKRIKPDVIISDSTFFISIPVYILSRIFGIPLVIYCRELILEITRYKKTPLRFLRKFVIKKSELVVAMDEGLKEYFQKEIDREVHLIPISINLENFKLRDIREELNLPAGDKLILYQGNLSKYRRLDILLEAFSKIKPAIGNSKLILAGRVTVGDSEYLNSLIERSNLKECVILLPWLPYSDVPSLIYSCDVCVDPYPRTGIEEFQVGLKIIEYMAAGKPILAINIKGNRFVIKDGYNGLLAEPNVEDFSKKLLMLVNDEKLSNKLGENALKTIKKNYDSKIVGDKFEKLINTPRRK